MEAAPEAIGQLAGGRRVGTVARVDVMEQRQLEAAAGQQSEPDLAQVVPLLLVVASFGDRVAAVRRRDERVQVGRVEHEQLLLGPDRAVGDQASAQLLLDPLDRRLGHLVHRIPDPPVVEVGGRNRQRARKRRLRVPLAHPQLRAGGVRTVHDHKLQVATDRMREPRGRDLLVDQRAQPETLGLLPQHKRPRLTVPSQDRLRLLPRLLERLGRPQVDLLDDPRFAIHPRRARPIEVLAPALPLPDDRPRHH